MIVKNWTYEDINDDESKLLTPSRSVVAKMSKMRARAIAAALNTPQGRDAFRRCRHQYAQGRI